MKDSVTRAARVLVVDDEADIRALIEITLNRMGLEVAAAGDLAAARRQLEDFRFDLCLTDMRLPDGDGIALVTELQRRYPHTPVAVITAYGSAQTAVDSLKAGAFDFVSKPLQVTTLRKLVDDALRLRGTNSPAPTALETELLGEAPAIRKLRTLIERVARSQAPVHITGESGTGKELVARTIHALGPRANAPFVPVNCGAIPADLMESELFGHVRGSFTGAVADNPGLFRAAEGGTLFLDEVADLPLHMQVKLLRAVQERAVRAVGATSETPVDVRIVSATHENLARRVADGSFRQDLYYRLNVIELQTPPLRDHAQDIPLLARRIVERISARTGNARPAELTADALTALTAYSFPGNVRELENILERALALCDTTQITAADLALRDAPPCADAQRVLPSASLAHRPDEAPLDARVEGLQREAIVAALEKTRWNRTRAADLLGMSFRQLRYRLKKLGIE
ncbi:MAG TPA: sigma-54 dependent transcriptional regulator [Nevskiaceae bacterium]|nr:sigma-54 dependent transcriptional regulator [Nevskiaceae bacterium]